MRRTWAYMLPAMMLTGFGVPQEVEAQVTVRAQLVWQWNDGSWRPHRYDWDARADRYYLGSGIWISAGYLPPAGYCREWIPGVPPAWQPAPVPCDELFMPYGYVHAGVVILGSTGYRGPTYRARIRERYDRDRFFRQQIARERAVRERKAWEHRGGGRVVRGSGYVVRGSGYKEVPNRRPEVRSRSSARSEAGRHGPDRERGAWHDRGRGNGNAHGNRGKSHGRG